MQAKQSSNSVEPFQDFNSGVEDTQTVLISSHVLIRDKNTNQILVNKRGS